MHDDRRDEPSNEGKPDKSVTVFKADEGPDEGRAKDPRPKQLSELTVTAKAVLWWVTKVAVIVGALFLLVWRAFLADWVANDLAVRIVRSPAFLEHLEASEAGSESELGASVASLRSELHSRQLEERLFEGVLRELESRTIRTKVIHAQRFVLDHDGDTVGEFGVTPDDQVSLFLETPNRGSAIRLYANDRVTGMVVNYPTGLEAIRMEAQEAYTDGIPMHSAFNVNGPVGRPVYTVEAGDGQTHMQIGDPTKGHTITLASHATVQGDGTAVLQVGDGALRHSALTAFTSKSEVDLIATQRGVDSSLLGERASHAIPEGAVLLWKVDVEVPDGWHALEDHAPFTVNGMVLITR